MLTPELDKFRIALASTDWVADALCNPGLRRALAIAHLAIDDGDSLAWRGIIELTLGLGPVFVEQVYDARRGRETFGAALLRLHRDRFAGFAPGAARRAAQLVDDIHAVLDTLDISQPPSDDRGWTGWLLDLVPAPADPGVVQLIDLVTGTLSEGGISLRTAASTFGRGVASATVDLGQSDLC
jgi:hypothetical protein